MTKINLILLISVLNLNLLLGQTEPEIELLLNQVAKTKYSKNISKTRSAKKIISFGKRSLPILAKFFTDSTLTKSISKCYSKGIDKPINVNGELTIGEIAIIIADEIEYLPLMKITGTHSCIPISCNKFSHIESSLFFINGFGMDRFKTKYISWLNSKERGDWLSLISKSSR